MTNPYIPGIINDLAQLHAQLHASLNLSHAQELAECRAALQAASELLLRQNEKIEQITTQMLQLLDEINTEKP